MLHCPAPYIMILFLFFFHAMVSSNALALAVVFISTQFFMNTGSPHDIPCIHSCWSMVWERWSSGLLHSRWLKPMLFSTLIYFSCMEHCPYLFIIYANSSQWTSFYCFDAATLTLDNLLVYMLLWLVFYSLTMTDWFILCIHAAWENEEENNNHFLI